MRRLFANYKFPIGLHNLSGPVVACLWLTGFVADQLQNYTVIHN